MDRIRSGNALPYSEQDMPTCKKERNVRKMNALIEWLWNPFVLLVYNVMVKLLIHILLINIVWAWMDMETAFKKILFFAMCGMIFDVLPAVAVTILFPSPAETPVWIFHMCAYSNPLNCFFYYMVNRYAFHFTPIRATVMMNYSILINYILTTLLLLLNDLFCWLSIMNPAPDMPSDYLSSVIILGVWFAVWYRLKKSLKKNGRYLIIPPNYSDQKNSRNIIQIFLTVCFIYGAMILFRIHQYDCGFNPINFATALIHLLLITGMLFYLLNSVAQLENKLLNWEMQATGTYISSLLHTNQEFRAVKNDFYHVLQGYGAYLSEKDYEGLEKYHNKLFTNTKQAGDFLSMIEVLWPRIAVYSLLESMAKKAKEVYVSFSVGQICDMTDVTLDDMDLCRVLSIVLDNAIEEAQLSAGKQVNLSFERKYEKTVILVVSNTTKGDVDTKEILKNGFTTKANHAGIGLPQVVHILNHYQHCSLRINYHENQFTVFLILSAEAKGMV